MRKRYDDLRGVERVLTAATVAALGAGALVGCGSSEEAPRNATQPTAATAEATSSATANPSIEASADEKTPQPE